MQCIKLVPLCQLSSIGSPCLLISSSKASVSIIFITSKLIHSTNKLWSLHNLLNLHVLPKCSPEQQLTTHAIHTSRAHGVLSSTVPLRLTAPGVNYVT
eukprot:1161177-Pelagomonas_calceolata.AAC.3